MSIKLYDKFLFILSAIIVSPLILLAFFTLVIGYPLHMLKRMVTKKVAVFFLFILLAASPSYALNILEKMIYKEAVIKTYNVKVLVAPFSNEVKYIWCGNPESGYWMPVSGRVKQQYQAMYDGQN